MIDKEKVIKGLECCANDKPFYHAHCDECPYNGRKPDNMGGCTKLYHDALELLKDQETTFDDYYGDYKCSACKTIIKSEIRYMVDNINYCPYCGKAVKWNGMGRL